jgi:uncharacterized membrane protein YdbT with pleckstrin-like domain
MADTEQEVIRLHPSLRTYLGYVVWPIVAIPLLIFVIEKIAGDKDVPVLVYVILAAVLLLIPFVAWVKTRIDTFEIKRNAVHRRKGLLTKLSNEIRIADIRAVNITQGLFQRLTGIGNVGFSSAAGDQEEVQFPGVRNPEWVKKTVQARMEALEEEAEERGRARVGGDS